MRTPVEIAKDTQNKLGDGLRLTQEYDLLLASCNEAFNAGVVKAAEMEAVVNGGSSCTCSMRFQKAITPLLKQ